MHNDILEIEGRVLGAILANPALYSRAAFLPSEAFQDASHRTVWDLICEARAGGRTATAAALATATPDRVAALGGLAYLNRLEASGERIVTVFNEALDRIYDELQWRRVALLSERLSRAASDREASPHKILSSLSDVARQYLSGGRSTLRTKTDVARAAIEEAQNRGTLVRTGIDSLDLLLQGGLHPRRLYGIGGLFGRGKTIFLGSISDNLNIQESPHLFLSLETPPEDIEIRSCAKHLNLNSAAVHDIHHPDYARLKQSADSYLDRKSVV